MENSSRNLTERNLAFIKWGSVGICLLLLFVYAWIYQAEPFDGPGYDYSDNWALDILTFIPAIAAAVMASLVTAQFRPGEAPRRIWQTFALGWWCWVAGEIAGMVYDYFYWDVPYPDLTLIDLCWSAGYFFFGLALFYQFRLIYSADKKSGINIYLTLLTAALLLTLGLTQLALRVGLGDDISWFALYLAVLYPVLDLAVGAAALWLFFLFGSGKWGRPWWALIAFAVADSINIYFWIGGGDNLADETLNAIYLFSDTVYVAGYLVLALAFLSMYLILRYELPSRFPDQQ
jgi:hypothetical protein